MQLQGTIAVVTGATRGAGKGIALALGEAGATVYVTGRSTRESGTTRSYPGTIEETAEAVTARGGHGIPMRVDHGVDEDVRALFERVASEHGRLDILVNNAWGGHDDAVGIGDAAPFWKLPTTMWDGMLNRGARYGLISSTYAAPLMVDRGRGLIVSTTFWDRDRYTGHFYYDLAKSAINRMAFNMAQDLKPYGVASIGLSPGWMRTELVLQAFDTDGDRWHEVPALATTESTHYIGRAVVALATDPDVMSKTGQMLRVGDLAHTYGFRDIDGRQPEAFEIEGEAPTCSLSTTP